MKLYEAEELLENYPFIRLSQSAIGNLDRMSHFELSFNEKPLRVFRIRQQRICFS